MLLDGIEPLSVAVQVQRLTTLGQLQKCLLPPTPSLSNLVLLSILKLLLFVRKISCHSDYACLITSLTDNRDE